jgi:hypothetical protein
MGRVARAALAAVGLLMTGNAMARCVPTVKFPLTVALVTLVLLGAAGCGGGGPSWPTPTRTYWGNEVQPAFTAAGIPLHRLRGLGSTPGLVWLGYSRADSDRFTAAYVFANRKNMGGVTTYGGGSPARSTRNGNVILQWNPHSLDRRVRAALAKMR